MIEKKENDNIVNSWEALIDKLKGYVYNSWLFRGQNRGKDLKPKLERLVENDRDKVLNKMDILEKEILKEFRRKYRDIDSVLVEKDTLYALSVIRHFEGPTRLLDASYSMYVAIFNALIDQPVKDNNNEVFIWLINQDWCLEKVNNIFGAAFINNRNENRTEESYLKMYMRDQSNKFVFIENSFKINERLDVQQGVLLCPGDLTVSFMDNLKAMDNWEEYNKKIIIDFSEDERKKSLMFLHRMNINRKSLYPGKEGFIKDLNEYVLRRIYQNIK